MTGTTRRATRASSRGGMPAVVGIGVRRRTWRRPAARCAGHGWTRRGRRVATRPAEGATRYCVWVAEVMITFGIGTQEPSFRPASGVQVACVIWVRTAALVLTSAKTA